MPYKKKFYKKSRIKKRIIKNSVIKKITDPLILCSESSGEGGGLVTSTCPHSPVCLWEFRMATHGSKKIGVCE